MIKPSSCARSWWARYDTDSAEISSGLKGGERIVTAGVHKLLPQQASGSSLSHRHPLEGWKEHFAANPMRSDIDEFSG